MTYVLIYLLVLFITFIPMYLITYYFPLKKNNLGTQAGVRYIVNKYKLKMDKKKTRLLSKIIAGVNTFILSIPIMLVIFSNINRVWLFVIAFIIFVVGIVGLYSLIGFILKKKGW